MPLFYMGKGGFIGVLFHIRRIAHYGIEAACGKYAGKGSLKIKGVDFAADVFVLGEFVAHDVHDFVAD